MINGLVTSSDRQTLAELPAPALKILTVRGFPWTTHVTMCGLRQYNDYKYAGLARILHPTEGALEAANASSAASVSKPELR